MFEFDFLKIRQRNFCKEEHWLNGFPVQWLKTEEDSYQKSKHRQGNENWNIYNFSTCSWLQISVSRTETPLAELRLIVNIAENLIE